MSTKTKIIINLDKNTYLKFKCMAKKYHCSVPDLFRLMIRISWNHFVWILSDSGFISSEDFWLWKN